MLITFGSVNFSYGDNLILQDVNFSINEGEKVGLVGENGAGKTTLIKLITGELYSDGGEIIKKNGAKLGYLAQNGGYDGDGSVYEEMRKVFSEELAAIEKVNELSVRLSECEFGGREYTAYAAKIDSLGKFIASRSGYDVDVKIKTVLSGMGFDGLFDRKISVMSGGEKTRLKLARLLLEEPDLLILDEPTNHLDIKTMYWLEDYLSTFGGAVFVVSHDRYFLDRVTRRTFEIENKKLSTFAGGYSKYKVLKKERFERAMKEYEKQQEEIKKLQTYVDKNIVRATTAKSAQSRVKQLERMEILEKPFTPPKPPRFEFTYAQRPAEEVISVDGLNLSVGGKTLICGGQLKILRGKKVAIVGENGTGKSTLLHEIVKGERTEIRRGRFVEFAFYDQEMANLNAENTVLAELWERHVAYSQTEVRASLARCGLYPEDMEKKVGALSGGERAKLALCVFENTHGNVLVLDEPTNHLDLPARESLETALKNFDGTVVFVSHDRYFLAALADEVAEIENCRISLYRGGYEGYRAAKEKEAEEAREQQEWDRQKEYEAERQRAYRSKKERAKEAQLKSEIKRIESDISRNEALEEELNAMLSDPAVGADYSKIKEIADRLSAVRSELDVLYVRYGELIE